METASWAGWGRAGAWHAVLSACSRADWDPFEFAAGERSDIQLILLKAEGAGVFICLILGRFTRKESKINHVSTVLGQGSWLVF